MNRIYDSLVARSADATPIYRSLQSRYGVDVASSTVPGSGRGPTRAEVATAPRSSASEAPVAPSTSTAAPAARPLHAATWPLGRISG